MAFLTPLGGNTADSSATTITADTRSADPFTKTGLTFTEVTASTSENWAGFYVNIAQGVTGVASVWSGAIGSEVRIASLPTRPKTIGLEKGLMQHWVILIAKKALKK